LKDYVKIAEAADGPTASEALICEVTGVSQPLRHNWIPKYGLRRLPRGTYQEYDARQLAALKSILEVLGPADASVAWDLIREPLVRVWDERPLVLLFDLQDKESALVSLMPALADALPYGHRILAIRLDDPLARASRAFRRATGSR
jgi:hypothetical protein